MISLIIGTNRPGSNSKKVAAEVVAIYKELGEDVHILDLAFLPAEIFSPLSYSQKPAAFAPFIDAVLKSDGLVVVTPEYNGSIPGILKYFIDMLPFPESFEHKPVSFVGLSAGIWGALRPVEQLQQIWGYRNGFIHPERVFIPGINSQLDAVGKLKDPALLKRLQSQASSFLDFTRRLKHS